MLRHFTVFHSPPHEIFMHTHVKSLEEAEGQAANLHCPLLQSPNNVVQTWMWWTGSGSKFMHSSIFCLFFTKVIFKCAFIWVGITSNYCMVMDQSDCLILCKYSILFLRVKCLQHNILAKMAICDHLRYLVDIPHFKITSVQTPLGSDVVGPV